MNPCPRCHVALSAGEFAGVELDRCERCGGLWLTPADLKEIIDAAPPAEAEAGKLGVDLTGVQEDAPCPGCGAAMGPFNYAGDSGIILDKCPHCDSLWLDAGDLERILAAVAASNRDLDRDRKRFSADLYEAGVRQDRLEQRDGRPIHDPLAASIASQIADADPRP